MNLPQEDEKATLKCCQIPLTLASKLDMGGVGTKGASQFRGVFETMQLFGITSFFWRLHCTTHKMIIKIKKTGDVQVVDIRNRKLTLERFQGV